MDEPCPKIVLQNGGDKITVLQDSATERILLGTPHVCEMCEEDWTLSVENPIFGHCMTPQFVTIDFKDMVKCEYDPPIELPSPPNGHDFRVERTPFDPYHCTWRGEETYNGVFWEVSWIPYWLNGAWPPETLLSLWAPYEDGGIEPPPVGGLVYFSAPFTYGTKVQPCLPANGEWLPNQVQCSVLHPYWAATGGEGRVRW